MRTFFALLLIASAAVLTFGACPNQCSGHGVCGENDKCTCYTQPGLKGKDRPAWVGADCSQRTCPLGIGFAELSTLRNRVGPIVFSPATENAAGVAYGAVSENAALRVNLDEDANVPVDTTYVVRLASYTAGPAPTATFQWRLAADASFTTEVFDMPIAQEDGFQLPIRQGATANTRVRIHLDTGVSGAINQFDTYTFTILANSGQDFRPEDSNSAHQMVECSGRGMCDRESGRCQCFDGFGGEACQRTQCPNECSGHGVCQDERRFVKDANLMHNEGDLLYTEAYDARKEMGCLCDHGFRGADCSQIECPSGADILGGAGGLEGRDCSGRGVCDYTSGVCKCFKGYYGERCESQTNYI